MNIPSWAPIVAALLSGGAAGAIITAMVASYRNRVQPVAYRITARNMFQSANNAGQNEVRVVVGEGDGKQEFDNLHEVTISLYNSGNIDRDTLEFGLSLGAGERAVLIETSTPDRHHKFLELPAISASEGLTDLDFAIAPFNRTDVYAIVLYVISDDTLVTGRDIVFSSPSSVRFTPAPDVSRALLGFLRSATVFPGGYVGPNTAEILRLGPKLGL